MPLDCQIAECNMNLRLISAIVNLSRGGHGLCYLCGAYAGYNAYSYAIIFTNNEAGADHCINMMLIVILMLILVWISIDADTQLNANID